MTSKLQSSLPARGGIRIRALYSANVRWLVKRVLLSVFLLWLVSVLVFWATQGLPGDVATIIVGRGATPEQIAAVTERLNLDRPLPQQYIEWLAGFFTGGPGLSLTAGVPVLDMVGSSIRNSYLLVVLSMAITFPLSVFLGVFTAARRDRIADKAMLGISIALNALPEFVVGTLLVVFFATSVLHVLPAISLIPPNENPLAYIPELVLPVVTLCLLGVTYLYRLVRASVIDVLESEYIQMATLKGLSNRVILFKHALPNAVVPTLQATAIVFAYSLGGIVVIEYVFGYPGMGTALTQAVASKDLPVIQFLVMLIAASFVLLNLIADLLAVYLSPRARTGGAK